MTKNKTCPNKKYDPKLDWPKAKMTRTRLTKIKNDQNSRLTKIKNDQKLDWPKTKLIKNKTDQKQNWLKNKTDQKPKRPKIWTRNSDLTWLKILSWKLALA